MSLICLLRFKYISNLIGNYILTNCCGPSYGPSYGLSYGASYVAYCVSFYIVSSCGLFYGPYCGAYVDIIKLVFY